MCGASVDVICVARAHLLTSARRMRFRHVGPPAVLVLTLYDSRVCVCISMVSSVDTTSNATTTLHSTRRKIESRHIHLTKSLTKAATSTGNRNTAAARRIDGEDQIPLIIPLMPLSVPSDVASRIHPHTWPRLTAVAGRP